MNKISRSIAAVCSAATVMCMHSTSLEARPTPVGTAFTYQGQLKQGGNHVNATADFQFTLFDVPAGGSPISVTVPVDAVTVTNGLFTVVLDFGTGMFGSEARWLDIAVRSPAGGGVFTPLSPRQAVLPAPLAQFALSVNGATITNLNASNITTGTLPSAAFSGNYGGAVNFTNPGNVFGGAAFNGSGAGLNNLNASNFASGTLPIARGGTGATSASAALNNLNAQARVTGTAPFGSYIRIINDDGTVVTGIDQDTNTTYSAGSGLQLSGTTFNVAADGITPAMLANNANSLSKVSGGVMSASAVIPSANIAAFLDVSLNVPGNINPMLTLRQSGVGSVAAMSFRNAAANTFAFGMTPGNMLAINYNANIDQTDLIRISSTGNLGLGVLVPTFKIDLPNVATDAGGRGRANAWTTYSSIRWKENVQTIPDALDKVMGLRGVYFDWKAENGGGRDIGFIAEEVGELVPELVSWETDAALRGYAQSLKYDRIAALAVNAIQELRLEKDRQLAQCDLQIANQQREIETLQSRLESLESMMQKVLAAESGGNQ